MNISLSFNKILLVFTLVITLLQFSKLNGIEKSIDTSILKNAVLGLEQTKGISSSDLPLPEKLYPELKKIFIEAGDKAPEVIKNKILQEIAEENLKVAKSQFYPRLSTGVSFGASSTFRAEGETTNNFGSSGSLGMSRPLYHWGAVHANIDSGKLNYKISSRIIEQSFLGIIQDFREDYLELIINNIELRNIKLDEGILRDDFDLKKSEFESGRLSGEDYLSFQISLEESFLKIERLLFKNKNIARAFEYASGVKINLAGPAQISPIDLNIIKQWVETKDLSEYWYSNTRKILNQQDKITREDKNFIMARAQQLPNFNFSASLSQSFADTASSNDVQTINAFAGVGVGWNIFDGFATKARKRTVLARKRLLEQSMNDLEFNILEEESSTRRELLLDSDSLRLSEKLFSLQKKQFDRLVEDQKRGTIALSELNISRQGHFKQEIAISKLRVKMLTSIANYLTVLEEDPAITYLGK